MHCASAAVDAQTTATCKSARNPATCSQPAWRLAPALASWPCNSWTARPCLLEARFASFSTCSSSSSLFLSFFSNSPPFTFSLSIAARCFKLSSEDRICLESNALCSLSVSEMSSATRRRSASAISAVSSCLPCSPRSSSLNSASCMRRCCASDCSFSFALRRLMYVPSGTGMVSRRDSRLLAGELEVGGPPGSVSAQGGLEEGVEVAGKLVGRSIRSAGESALGDSAGEEGVGEVAGVAGLIFLGSTDSINGRAGKLRLGREHACCLHARRRSRRRFAKSALMNLPGKNCTPKDCSQL
mmetsp:Transcript_58428/g.130222  ORF Transcript_58428/g.130222 Transcript_58428/m.130222 type:complete len:299 (-) Transcript_58428:26-922(-)